MIAELLRRLRAWLNGLDDRTLALPSPAARPPARPAVAPVPVPPPVVDREREARVAQRSRALAVRLFGANHPVESPQDLFGRQRELTTLSDSVLDGGMHAVIFGARGSGKTSLVRVFGDLADARGFTVIYLSCAGGSGFGEIMLPYLEEIGPESLAMRPDEYAEALAATTAAPTPRAFASLLARADAEQLVLILDEFDRLEEDGAKSQLALLAKLLSDMRASTRLVFVGIAGNVGDLVDVHPSVRRHLVAVGLRPLADSEVEKFVRTTSQAIGLDFTAETLALLCWLVCGSPYHMRLFSLQTCLVAIERNRKRVDESIVLAGLERAVAGWHDTNERDAALFSSLARGRTLPRSALEAFATTAATRLEFTPDDLLEAFGRCGVDPALIPALVDALTPALGRAGEASRLLFQDVLAPQFLLAMCALARMDERSSTLAVGGMVR